MAGPLDQNHRFPDSIKWLFINGWTIGPLDQNHRFSDSIKWLFLNCCIFWPLDQNQRFTGYIKWLFINGWIFGRKIIWYASHQLLQVILDLWTFGLKTDNKKSLYQRWYSNGVWIFGRKTKLICVLIRHCRIYFMYCLTSQVSQVSNLGLTFFAIERWVLHKSQSDFIKWPIIKNCHKKSGSFHWLGVVLNLFKVPGHPEGGSSVSSGMGGQENDDTFEILVPGPKCCGRKSVGSNLFPRWSCFWPK